MKQLLFVFVLGLVITAGFSAATTVTGSRQAIACDGGDGGGSGGADDNGGGK
jgi:hypothetical protein